MGRRKKHKRQLPKYGKAVVAALEKAKSQGRTFQAGSVHVINVEHDEWCNLLKGGECNCNPDVCSPEKVPDYRDN